VILSDKGIKVISCFGSNDYPVSVGSFVEYLPDQLFGVAESVHIGGIDKIYFIFVL